MSDHLAENLPRLLTGDANRVEVMAAAEHLRSCPDCQQELVSAVVAHASLTSARRFAPEIVSPERAELDLDADSAAAGPLPDLSSVFETARAEAAASPVRSLRTAHRGRLLAVAAAAVVLVGGGVTIAETVGGADSPASRTVKLSAFDQGTKPAKATLTGGQTMRIDASALPKLDASHRYEVWLTDDRRKQMLPVGPIGRDNRAELTVPPTDMAKYHDIEISVQRTDQLTDYSGISVLRGSYQD
ncbi:anti-sigma factor domain-containing protein [uncultured Jatrophihabitans sp.]|uniref:anti-sigma factor domain-containing protein n=1 Tax=uncultured Jatrophihabitans sp. TaxID=1610747 RepID=UPI0035C9CAB9